MGWRNRTRLIPDCIDSICASPGVLPGVQWEHTARRIAYGSCKGEVWAQRPC